MTERLLVVELQKHLKELSNRLGGLSTTLHAYVAGGVAVHYHTGHRMSDDEDIKLSHRVAIPPDMQVFEVADPDAEGDYKLVTMDGGFSDVLGSFPPDWESRSPEIARVGDVAIHIMEPNDLAVSKVSRFQDRDREDIKKLAEEGLIDIKIFKERVEEALKYYVGDTTFIVHNVADALKIIQDAIDDPEP